MMNAKDRTALIEKIYHVDDKNVFGFFKEHRFLSNFHVCEIEYKGLLYGSTEAAYQAQKTFIPEIRAAFSEMTPSKAKSEGRKVKLRDDWDIVKWQIMFELIRKKFREHENLWKQLIDTGERYLEETNYWGDRFWGADINHKGENHLGKILMTVRKGIIQT